MQIEDIQKFILELYKDSRYQELNAYYNETTLFNILRSERSENRFNAVICWLLDPEQSHGLKYLPLRKLLSLYAYKTSGDFSNVLLSGDYDIISVEECTNEKVVGALTSGNERRRIDIWVLMTIKAVDNELLVPIIIENKVFASEGNEQTTAYHQGMEIFCKKRGQESCVPVEIYLTPDGAKECSCKSFCHVTYQELLDYVIEPVSVLSSDARSEMIIGDFIKNLAIPTSAHDSDKEDKEGKDSSKAIKELANSILAVSSKEKSNLVQLYKTHKAIFDLAIVANGNGNVLTLFPQYPDYLDPEVQQTLEGLWNSNFNLFMTVLYVCRETILPGKETELLKLFLTSRRDNSRYVIEVKDSDGNWNVHPDVKKPMSKALTVAEFFRIFTDRNMHAIHSLEELRKVFPSKLNSCYSHNSKENPKYGNSVVWELCSGPEDEQDNTMNDGKCRRSYARAENGFMVKVKDAKWDFYTDLKTGYDGSKNALIVKMWRKEDFDKFRNHVAKENIFSDIRIVEL